MQREIAEEIVQGIGEVIRRTRSIAHGLCPVGLSALRVHRRARGIGAERGETARSPLSSPGARAVDVGEDPVASHLFQIVEEAVNNAVRHSQARQIEIAIVREDTQLSVSVRDNGVGLPKDVAHSPGMGLRTMRYRAEVLGGTSRSNRRRTGGTVVLCVLPAADPPRATTTPAPLTT